MHANRSGLSLFEVLVMIAMVVITVSVSLPGLNFLRMRAESANDKNRLRQVMVAVQNAESAMNRYPPASGPYFDMQDKDRSLSYYLLVYMQHCELCQKIRTQDFVPMADVPTFHDSCDTTTTDFLGVQNFAANLRVFSNAGFITQFNAPVVGLNSSKDGKCDLNDAKLSMLDGTSNTVFFATRYANNGTVNSKGNVNCSSYEAMIPSNNGAFFGVNPMTGQASATSPGGFQLSPSITEANCSFGQVAHSFTRTGILVGMGDMSTRMVGPNISPQTWNMALQPNDGIAVGNDWVK